VETFVDLRKILDLRLVVSSCRTREQRDLALCPTLNMGLLVRKAISEPKACRLSFHDSLSGALLQRFAQFRWLFT
jgi:hypothetical protein